LKHKKLSIFKCYIQRAVAIWNEIGLDVPHDFAVLDNYAKNWLDTAIACKLDVAESTFSLLLQSICRYDEEELFTVPTFAVHSQDGSVVFYFNNKSYSDFCVNVSHKISVPFDLRVTSAYKDESLAEDQGAMAREILSQAHESLVIVWSAIDSYELLDVQTSSERISELGIHV
jgi:hypothetical protein